MNAVRTWVSRAAGMAGEAVSGAVLLREAARTSRRWQTYAARAAFSGILLGVLLLGIWAAVDATRGAVVDTANLAWLGRGLFIGFGVVQALLAILLAPLMATSAIMEETEERTMEILVLTRLRPTQILGAKVLSRVLVLATVVFGALPVMALVVNLGGVSSKEVLSVTAHTLTTVALLASLGGFFALFTRSPMLATVASASYAVPMFILLPMAYILCTGDPYHAAHFSTFAAGSARDWGAVLTPLGYLPSLVMIFAVAAPLFQLKVSNADIRHAFADRVWQTRSVLIAAGVYLAVAFVTLPFAVVASWGIGHSQGTPSTLTAAVHVAAVGWIWVLFSVLAAFLTWGFLRVGMDVVDGIDGVFTSGPAGEAHGRTSSTVGSNPVWWREARPRAWASSAAPIFVTWGLVALAVFQTGWWLVPGGLLSIGATNAVAALLLSGWFATRSIAEERRRGTLEVLIATTMPSSEIISGKIAAVVLPTFPLLLLSGPLIAIGVPHLHVVSLFDDGLAGSTEMLLCGVGTWIWLLPIWGLVILGSMILALRTARPRAAFGMVATALAVLLGVPAVVARAFPDQAWVTLPARILAPPLAGGFEAWHLVMSILLSTLLCVGLLLLLVRRLRPWVGLLAVLLAALLASGSARAAAPTAEEIAAMEKVFRLRMSVTPLADGLARAGRWTTLHVAVENLGGATVGTLALDEPQGDGEGTVIHYERPIELAEGARKDVTMLVRTGGGGTRTVTLTTREGRRALAGYTVQLRSEDDVLIGVIGTDPLGLPALIRTATSDSVAGAVPRAAIADDRTVRTGLIGIDDAPRHSAGWRTLDYVVWPAADPSRMSAGQAEALAGWVLDGGHLVLTVSDTWRQVAGSPLDAILPVTLTGLADTPVDALLDALTIAGNGSQPVALSEPRPQAVVRARSSTGVPLWVSGAYGTGSVHLVLASLTTTPLSQARNEEGLRRLLTLPAPGGTAGDMLARDPRVSDAVRTQLHVDATTPFGAYNTYESQTPEDGWEAVVRERLSDIPGVAPLPMKWLALFAVVYLLAIGPGDYFALWLIGRQTWTWITFPTLIVVFSAASLALTTYTKGSQSILVRVEVVDLFPGVAQARGQTFIGLFSTGKTQLELRSEFDDSVLAPLRVPGFQNDPRVVAGDGPGGLSWGAETWTLAYARSDWTAPVSARLLVHSVEGRLVARNDLGFDLEGLALLVPGAGSVSGWVDLGPLARGAEVVLPDSGGTVAAHPIPTPDVSDAPLRWAVSTFHTSLPADRGTIAAEWRPVLLGVGTAELEPIRFSGLAPVIRPLIVVRSPIDADIDLDVDLTLDAIVLRFDPSTPPTGADLQCENETFTAYASGLEVRFDEVPVGACTVTVWTDDGGRDFSARRATVLECGPRSGDGTLVCETADRGSP